MRFTQKSDGRASVEALQHAFMRAEFLDAVQRAVVESVGAMGLGLQSNSYVFDWRAQECVGDSGEGSGSVVLTITK